jgi:hypothetical protein
LIFSLGLTLKKNPQNKGVKLNYNVFLFFCLEYNFDPPYKTPAAINKEIPPSIGMQGGGQHAAPPVGGGAGAPKHEV